MNTLPPTIHLIRTSAFADNKLQLCIDTLGVNDELFLLDDGTYNVNHALLTNLSNPVYVLDEHLTSRAVSAGEFEVINYVDLVQATVKAGKVITWQ